MSPGGNRRELSVVLQTGRHTRTQNKLTRPLIAHLGRTIGSFKFGGTRIAWKQGIGIGNETRKRVLEMEPPSK